MNKGRARPCLSFLTVGFNGLDIEAGFRQTGQSDRFFKQIIHDGLRKEEHEDDIKEYGNRRLFSADRGASFPDQRQATIPAANAVK